MTSHPATGPAASVFTVNDNGAWCWFQDERALVDRATDTLLIGSVASAGGVAGAGRGGDVDLTVVDLGSGSATIVRLHAGLESDDHDAPALWHRADGRWVAMYSRHKADELTRWRISEPDDPTRWGPERSFDWLSLFTSAEEATSLGGGRGVTYQNIHRLDGVLHCFVRAINDDPCYLVSHDDGTTWSFGGRLLTRPGVGYVNGYTRFASETHHGADGRIDLIVTEHHPRDFGTSVWHGFLADGALRRADGSVVGPLGRGLPESTPRAEDLTSVFTNGSDWNGSVMTHAWVTDLRRGPDGTLVALFTARADDTLGTESDRNVTDPIDHRFFRATLYPGEARWGVHELARAGPQLLPHEEDYTGLGSIDPDNPDALYLSTVVDPRDGSAWRKHEIVHGHTPDRGATWHWTPITRDSAVDNFRPIAVPGDPGRAVVIWYRGSMRSSQDYDAQIVVGVADRR